MASRPITVCDVSYGCIARKGVGTGGYFRRGVHLLSPRDVREVLSISYSNCIGVVVVVAVVVIVVVGRKQAVG